MEDEKKIPTEESELLVQFGRWKQDAENMRSSYQTRWAKNIQLMKGIWSEEEATRSKVRGRSKLFFRKIWGTMWRLLASFYQAFLKGPRAIFEVEGRGAEDVKDKAAVLEIMAQYHVDKMNAEQNLFLQHIWGMQNIFQYGVAKAKFCWEYRDGKDRPYFKVYPNEQVFCDLSVDMKDDMRFVMFENYMTKEEMKRNGYENIDKAEASSIPTNAVRNARMQPGKDPHMTGLSNHYPDPSTTTGGRKEDAGARYIVQEWFWREEGGKIMMAVTNESKVFLKKKKESRYGERYPLVMGTCLTEANKLFGEGFPEPLEGPQESINHLINVRKDNVHLALNKHAIVSRFANVDIGSLINSRPGAVTLADDPNAVKDREVGDVTQSSYMEAAQDEGMMQELGGVTDIKQGMARNEKATTAQINLTESNAKIELFIAVVAHTWFADFYRMLIYMIQRFETDKNIFRVANTKLMRERAKDYKGREVEDVDDFDADIRIHVGLNAAMQEQKTRNVMLAMDKAIMSNQSAIALLSSGAIRPDQAVRLFDLTKFMDQILPDLGMKNTEDFFFAVQGPPPMEKGSGTQNDAANEGAVEPQFEAMMGPPAGAGL